MTGGRGNVDLTARRFLIIIILLIAPGVTCAAERLEEILPEYTLDVTIDVRASTVKGIASIPVVNGRELRLQKGRLNLVQARIGDREIETAITENEIRVLPSHDGVLAITYEGTFKETRHGPEPLGVINEKGVFLSGAWYPKLEGMCQYHLTATLPKGYEAVSEAEIIEKSTRDGKTVFVFKFPHPLDGITLVASDRYHVASDRLGSIEIFAYFFAEDADLTRTYIEHAKRYLRLYGTLINAYPYKRFSMVETFLPAGYSMPTYTLLGQAVVRLPFIPETSLGHEVVHQWLGNSIYVDYSKGNWSEGLTTFLADHLYEEEKGRGWEYRKDLLIDYQSYVNERNQFPLRDFRARSDPVSKAIGYGKALMVFQMLKDMVGPELFDESIKHLATHMRFKKASWEDIKGTFEKCYQKDLASFFNQWVDGTGLPELHLENIEANPSGSNVEVAFTVHQKGKVYTLDLPVTVYSFLGKTRHRVRLSKERERFKVITQGFPQRIVLDEEYEVGRRLSIEEFPPVVARLLGDEKRIVVLPPSTPELYDDVMTFFKRKGDRVSDAGSIPSADLKSHSLVILGRDNPLVGQLYGASAAADGFKVVIKELPWNRWKVAAILDGASRQEIDDAFKKLSHYGKYSVLGFDRGINVYKKVEASARGITGEAHKEIMAAPVSALKTLPATVESIADKKIIYVGESHDRFSHHVTQLEIIRELLRQGKKIAVGLEMFQRPFQKVVDDYIEGNIDERTFLKGTEYFKRWGFDYALYRPILLFAQSEKIPVVALNQRREIVDKVSRHGLDSLSAEEKASLPSGMDFSDDTYRERLRKVFQEHRGFETRNFDFFYQAQVLWDETMAESIARFLRDHPDHQMVVLAGAGHLAYGSGIPNRTARRTGYDYSIVLNDADLEKGIADFVLSPGNMQVPATPKLMVILKEEAGNVVVTGFSAKSASEQAGMKVGDIILAIDRVQIHAVDDLKLELVSRRKGDRVTVTVLRKGFLGSTTNIQFDVILQ